MATGDVQGNLQRLLSELRHIRYPVDFDTAGATEGHPAALLPVLHYVLFGFSKHIAKYIVQNGYELQAKADLRFVEGTFKLLRAEWSYRATITPTQFLSTGFVERKLLLLVDAIQVAKRAHNDLVRKKKTVVSTAAKNAAHARLSAAPAPKQARLPDLLLGAPTTEVKIEGAALADLEAWTSPAEAAAGLAHSSDGAQSDDGGGDGDSDDNDAVVLTPNGRARRALVLAEEDAHAAAPPSVQLQLLSSPTSFAYPERAVLTLLPAGHAAHGSAPPSPAQLTRPFAGVRACGGGEAEAASVPVESTSTDCQLAAIVEVLQQRVAAMEAAKATLERTVEEQAAKMVLLETRLRFLESTPDTIAAAAAALPHPPPPSPPPPVPVPVPAASQQWYAQRAGVVAEAWTEAEKTYNPVVSTAAHFAGVDAGGEGDLREFISRVSGRQAETLALLEP